MMKGKGYSILAALAVIILIASGTFLLIKSGASVKSPQAKGKQLYTAECLRCHNSGMSTRGIFPTLQGVTDHMDKESIVEVIRNGDESGIMPAFKDLTRKEMKSILSYLATLEAEEETFKEPSQTKVATLSPEEKAQNLAEYLYCPCGCAMILQTCQCGTAPKIRNFILQGYSEGKTFEDVKANVVEEYGQQVLPVSEIKETLSPDKFAKIPRSYQIAREIPAILSEVPCFCRCAGLGHQNLLDCFKSTHGSRCEICMDEAILISELHKQGSKTDEINREITRKFYKKNKKIAISGGQESFMQKLSSFLRSIIS